MSDVSGPEELEVSRSGGGWLKGRILWPPKASGRAATLLALKWGEDKLEDWAVSWETDGGITFK